MSKNKLKSFGVKALNKHRLGASLRSFICKYY